MLPATAVADDLGFVALGDMARAADGVKYRLIGGHMLMMLIARWNLGAGLYRETRDADLGMAALEDELRLSRASLGLRFIRLRALIERVLGQSAR